MFKFGLEKNAGAVELVAYGPADGTSYLDRLLREGPLPRPSGHHRARWPSWSRRRPSTTTLPGPELFLAALVAFFLSLALFAYGVLASMLTANASSSLALFLGIIVFFLVVLFGSFAIVGEYVRNLSTVVASAVQWISPFFYGNLSLQANAAGDSLGLFGGLALLVVLASGNPCGEPLHHQGAGSAGMKRAAAVITLLLALRPAFAQAPVRTENLIYSVLAFNGRDYSPTFARSPSGTIYLIAGVDSFLTVRKTFVYFWPLTGEWKTDTDSLNVPFDGTLEVTGRRGTTVPVIPSRYTYFNERGEYELNWKVARDAEADRVWAHWAQIMDAYQAAMKDYRDRVAKQGAERSSLIARIQSLRNAGKDVTALVDQALEHAGARSAPAPAGLRRSARRDPAGLHPEPPSGEYSLRLRNPDGSIMEGSEKTLVVHEKRRSRGIGYEVIPGDKWTRPVESPTPSAVLYVDGSSDLYLRPFFEDEYNDLFYAKTIRNDASGEPQPDEVGAHPAGPPGGDPAQPGGHGRDAGPRGALVRGAGAGRHARLQDRALRSPGRPEGPGPQPDRLPRRPGPGNWSHGASDSGRERQPASRQ